MRKDYSEYIGKQFGELTILSISEPIKEKKYNRRCKCRCSCGNEETFWLQHVLRGDSTSCGHLHTKDYSEYVGKQFGELTILSISEPTKGKRYCTCECSCGEKIYTGLHSVLYGDRTSCGHLHTKDYSECIGKQFGELTILSISEPIKLNKNYYKRFCHCECSCSKEINVQLHSVLNGNTKSCGHLRNECTPDGYLKRIEIRNQNKQANVSNQSTGVKNISYSKRDCIYLIQITRNGQRYYDSASSLSEAIRIKERILQELGELD